MTDLVGYGSSDEEDFVNEDRIRTLQQSESPTTPRQRSPPKASKELTATSAEDEWARPSETKSESPFQAMTPASGALSAPSSTYTDHRTTVRSLTLPSKPNLDIPQSPLGLPTPDADQKFSHFLDLKKQGIHFNNKLASSSALRNPSLLPKLMDFAGVGTEWQYTTTLPTELWDPVGFPTWAYKEGLAETQHRFSRSREEKGIKPQRESIEFISAGIPRQSNGLVVPKAAKASAAERVMAGLDKDRKSSPQWNSAQKGRVERVVTCRQE